MKTKTAILLLLAVCSAGLEARIGETKEECQKRYGPILESNYFGTKFKKNDINIKVKFHKGKVIEITYMNLGATFNEKEVLKLLEVNHPKNDWVVDQKSYGYQTYRAENIKAMHVTSYNSSTLSIEAEEDYFKEDISGIQGL